MRGAFIVGLIIVSLVVGVLVIKNMDPDRPGDITETQAEKYIEKAENAADEINNKLNDISKRANQIQTD